MNGEWQGLCNFAVSRLALVSSHFFWCVLFFCSSIRWASRLCDSTGACTLWIAVASITVQWKMPRALQASPSGWKTWNRRSRSSFVAKHHGVTQNIPFTFFFHQSHELIVSTAHMLHLIPLSNITLSITLSFGVITSKIHRWLKTEKTIERGRNQTPARANLSKEKIPQALAYTEPNASFGPRTQLDEVGPIGHTRCPSGDIPCMNPENRISVGANNLRDNFDNWGNRSTWKNPELRLGSTDLRPLSMAKVGSVAHLAVQMGWTQIRIRNNRFLLFLFCLNNYG